MKLFHSGHLPPGFGDLEPVAYQHHPAVDAYDAMVNPKDQSAPSVGKLVQFQSLAVEEIQKAVIAGWLQAWRAHDAGDA
jgi:hypothetical protein